MEPRRFTTRQALAGYSAWPGLAQVFAWERSVILPKTGDVRAETVYGVTSLASPRPRLQVSWNGCVGTGRSRTNRMGCVL